MILSNDRTALRAMYRDAWRKRCEGAPLEPLETLIAEVVARHPEYHKDLEESGLEQDYLPEAGQTNPFLHMGLHLAVHEQVTTDRPAGIAAAYRDVLASGADAHEVEHRMMECLAEMIWQVQRHGTPPDEAGYLACVQKQIDG